MTLVVLMGAAACAPVGGSGSPTASPQEQFCDLFNEVAETPPVENAVLVKDDVVAVAEDESDVDVVGSDCESPTAKVKLDDALVAEGEEVPSEQNNPGSDPIAAITGDEITAGTPVLQNLSLTALSIEISLQGITIRGNVAVRLSGITSTIGFVGTLTNLNSWSVTLSSSNLIIPGINSTPATFSGTLKVQNGVPSLSMNAAVTTAKIGDITVSGAAVKFFASPSTGLDATVQGSIKVGPSTAGGIVSVDFNPAGALVSAKASLSAHLVGTQADGKTVDLQGQVKLDGNAQKTVVSFAGHGNVGDFIVNDASGELTLETNKASFLGVLDVQQGANTLRFNGALVWDGITAYVPYFNLEAAGEISGTLTDGQQVSAAGTIEAVFIGGQLRSVVTGSFKIGTLKAVGTAVVETNGHTTTLELEANLVDAGFTAAIAGAVVITDGQAELVDLSAAVQGSIVVGDATLTDPNLSVHSTYGNPLDVAFSGGLRVGTSANLTAAITASIGPDGKLLSLVGDVSGSLALDTWGVANFSGRIVATVDQVTVSGAGDIVLANFPAGLRISGNLTSSLTVPKWTLNGTAQLRLASLNILSARLRLSQAEGMKATRAGFYFNIVGIPTYFEGDFYMKPAGGCDHVNITGGGVIAKLILVTVLPGVIGCPVSI